MKVFRSGIGIESGSLKAGRKLILGGVEIDYWKGLGAHSSADALVHAMIDALLSAAGLGDFGQCFPEHVKKRKRTASLKLLDATAVLLEDAGWHAASIGASIIADEPPLTDYFKAMQKNIAKSLKLKKNRVALRVATTEESGFTGHGEGITAFAVATIDR